VGEKSHTRQLQVVGHDGTTSINDINDINDINGYQWHITILRFTEFTAVYLCPLDLASHQVPGENVEFIPGPFEAPENAAFRKASGLGEGGEVP